MGAMDDMSGKMSDMGDMGRDQMNTRLEELSNKAKNNELTDAERDEMAKLQSKL